MEAEKVHQEKVARTIQQKQDGGGALQLVDNRMVNTLLQRVGLEDEEGFQMKTAKHFPRLAGVTAGKRQTSKKKK